ncbi:MAG TPA: SGNH hydrolase domain-containing protein, partial [Solirubrobacteraceae bacterium]
ERHSRLAVCSFGAPADRARTTFALVGDSHASAWRGAFDPAARGLGWRGLSLTRTGCPLTAASLATKGRVRRHCRQWNREVTAWFARNPSVTTVFVAARAGLDVIGDEAAVARGYARAWDTLPASVRRIVVIRDTPRLRASTLDCVDAADADGRRMNVACAVPRRRALRPDPQLAAMRLVRNRRVVAIDLTPAFCDARACYPVIGGALAFRDEDHLTRTFAATLAPSLREVVRRATG